ncbi:endonuclease-reverse transcriptase [Danaus plexippus plexippus]|uniref:Endonuclease-reverse transcriptase n=1 Tax=Danaus plexippus plexippus TaxID=278856 RepID=A0A212EWM6_DANPL|nr:endonuclease-reverse transcriptase [Danaus plexippus plexippus]
MERSMMNVKKSDQLRNRIIRSQIKCYPRESKRKRSKRQKRWHDDVRQVAGVTWNRVTQERCGWKRLEEAFVDWQTDL